MSDSLSYLKHPVSQLLILLSGSVLLFGIGILVGMDIAIPEAAYHQVLRNCLDDLLTCYEVC